MGQFWLVCIYFFQKKILEELHPSLRDVPDGGKLVKAYSGISVVRFADSNLQTQTVWNDIVAW